MGVPPTGSTVPSSPGSILGLVSELHQEGVALRRQGLPTSVAARFLELSPQRVLQLAAEGKLKFELTPLGRLFDPDDLERARLERVARRGGQAAA